MNTTNTTTTTTTAATTTAATRLIARLAARAAALAGRPGVTAARSLVERVRAAAAAHARQLGGNPRRARDADQINRGQRRRAAALADAAAGYPLASFGRAPDAQRWPLRAVTDLVGEGTREIARVGEWWVSTSQEENRDWNFYSKAWHRQHGPKVTVESRTVLIRRVDARGRLQQRDQEVGGWRGNWALNALLAAGIVEKVKVPSRLRPVQLHAAFGVEMHRQFGDLAVYRRTLVGGVVDFCAYWRGLAYHAASPRLAVRGLRVKLAAAVQRRNSPITWEVCRALGFCEAGILQFCRDFDLDPKGSYHPDFVRMAVERNTGAAAPYAGELRTLAKAVGYKIPDHLA